MESVEGVILFLPVQNAQMVMVLGGVMGSVIGITLNQSVSNQVHQIEKLNCK